MNAFISRPTQIVFRNGYSSSTLGIWDEKTTHGFSPAPQTPRRPEDMLAGPRWYAITSRTLFDRAAPGNDDPFARLRNRLLFHRHIYYYSYKNIKELVFKNQPEQILDTTKFIG